METEWDRGGDRCGTVLVTEMGTMIKIGTGMVLRWGW